MYLFGQNMLHFAMFCQNKDISEVLIPGKTNINMNFNRRKHPLELKLCGVRITSRYPSKTFMVSKPIIHFTPVIIKYPIRKKL